MSQLNQTVLEKLEQKVQQLNLLLMPEGRVLLQRAKDEFIGAQIDVRALTERIKEIKDKYTLPSNLAQITTQQPNTIPLMVQPTGMNTPQTIRAPSPSSSQSLQQINPMSGVFTEEEQAMFKNMKTMDADARKTFVANNQHARELLKKLQQIKSSKTDTTVGVSINQTTTPQASQTFQPKPFTSDVVMQPPTKKKKQEEQQPETPTHTFTNDEEVHSFYLSRFQPETSFLNSTNLKNKIARILKTQQLKPTVGDTIIDFISLAVQDRMRSIVEELVLNSKTRMDTPINASDNASFIEIASTSNFSLINRELKVKQKILYEDEQRREEEERIKETQRKKQSGSSEGKRKRNQSSKEDEEQKMSDMNVAIDVALGKKSSTANLIQTGKMPSNLKKTASASSMTSTSKSSNGQDGDDESQLGKRPSSIVITPQDVILYLETEPLLRKSRLLHSLYLKLKE